MADDHSVPNDVKTLQERLQQALQRIQELEARDKQQTQAQDDAQRRAPEAGGLEVAPINEADVTLRRLVQRIAMILQAEKIVIMFYDREEGELKGIPPSYGVEEERLEHFRVRASQGISGQVYRDCEPIIFHDATADARTQKDPFGLINVHNGITVPLVIEKRDEENRVIDRTVIGVLHAFNKRHGEDFNDEDVRLLERMARNVGSIIANLQLYREVIEEREELLQTFESLTAGLMLISTGGRISQMNATARAIFTVGPEAIGQKFADFVKEEEVLQFLNAVQSGEEISNTDFAVVIAGAERIYEMQGAMVRNEDGRDLGVVMLFNDITEIRNIDRMKSSFVAMASHELRTPLTAIKGFVSTLLIDDSYAAEDRREFYQIIDHECDRLTRLINDLLNTARIEAKQSLKPNYTEVDVRSLLDKCVRIQQQSTSNHKLMLEMPNELVPIVGDEDKLDQIITNLLSNAIKYSPNGGTVTVTCVNEGDNYLISVSDEGMGIPPDHLPRVFDKFHRVHNDDNRKIYGTGLGLYLVKHLVEEVHLGKIWAESEVGKGSQFLFRIPTNIDIEAAKQIDG